MDINKLLESFLEDGENNTNFAAAMASINEIAPLIAQRAGLVPEVGATAPAIEGAASSLGDISPATEETLSDDDFTMDKLNGFINDDTLALLQKKTVREDGSMYSFEAMESLTNYLLKRTKHRPKLGVICGSGMGGLADMLEDKESFPYNEIPGFPTSTVAGHKGRLVFGVLNGVTMVCMQGRFHVYEGYSLWKCAMPVRVMKLIGVNTLIVTNAAGGLNPDFKAGDIMLIKDHINFPGFAGDNPLRGRNDERWGPRFPALNNAYDLPLRNLAKEIAKELGFSQYLQEGVYAMVGGPNYETVSELRALRTLGADAVGMSTAHEVIAARHCGLRVFGLSLITNECVMEYDVERAANHAEVLETSNRRKSDLEKLITKLVTKIDL